MKCTPIPQLKSSQYTDAEAILAELEREDGLKRKPPSRVSSDQAITQCRRAEEAECLRRWAAGLLAQDVPIILIREASKVNDYNIVDNHYPIDIISVIR